MATIDLKLKGLAEIRKELKQLQFDLSQATDPQQMAELSEKAGVLRDNLQRANEQVRVFAAGSPFEQTNNALGLMGSQIMSLDFEGAAESAKLFAQAAKGINGQVIATQLKGLGSTVTTLGSTFAKLGVTILANPIFLIAAAVAAIVAIIGVLMNKLGFLQPILDAVGEVFEAMKWAIDKAVESIKAFLDWLGLTNFAAQDFASQQQDAMQKVIDRTKELEVTLSEKYDHEIRLAKIAGEDTTQAELDKQKALQKTAEVRLRAIDQLIAQNKISKRFNEEEIEQLRTLRKETEKQLKQTNNEIEAINAQSAEDKQKDREREISENKAAYAKMLADRKKFEQDRLNAIRQIRDLEFELMENDIVKELMLNNEKYTRLIEDTLKNESLSDEEKQRLTDLLRQKQKQTEDQLVLQENEKEKANATAQHEALMALGDELGQDALAQMANYGEAELNQEGENFKQREAQELAYAAARENLQATLIGSLKGLSDSLTKAGIQNAGLQKTLALVDIATSTAKSISAVVAGATAAAASTGPAAPFVLAGYIASGIASVGSAIASAYAALKSAPSIGGGVSGGGSAPSIAGGGVQAAQPSVNLFGQNNNANNLTSPQSVEQSNEIVVKAIVSETEVTGTQNKIKKMTESAAL